MDFLVWVQKKNYQDINTFEKKYSKIIDNEDYSGIKKNLLIK